MKKTLLYQMPNEMPQDILHFVSGQIFTIVPAHPKQKCISLTVNIKTNERYIQYDRPTNKGETSK